MYLQVVLDLDETLVCAYESSSLPATVRTQAVEAGLHCFDMEGISSDKASMWPSFPPFPMILLLSSHFLKKVLMGISISWCKRMPKADRG
uniref:FCP1 homology domain-containing protein n=1 Tax=Aegilops tauschii subsp. strangulata TaxID=200361 RepID=A0A452ZB30_AEGTS